jgi:hypothetical protein
MVLPSLGGGEGLEIITVYIEPANRVITTSGASVWHTWVKKQNPIGNGIYNSFIIQYCFSIVGVQVEHKSFMRFRKIYVIFVVDNFIRSMIEVCFNPH